MFFFVVLYSQDELKELVEREHKRIDEEDEKQKNAPNKNDN